MRTAIPAVWALSALACCCESNDTEPGTPSPGGNGGAATGGVTSTSGGSALGGRAPNGGASGGRVSGGAGPTAGGKGGAAPLGGDGGTNEQAGGAPGEAGDSGSQAGAPGESGATGAGGNQGSSGSGNAGTAGKAGFDGDGVFVGVGYGGRRVRSIDGGMSWIDDQSGVAKGGDDEWLLRGVAFGGGQFVAVGYRAATSPDGAEWTVSEPMDQWIGGLAYAKERWVGAGGSGLRTTSMNGSTWRRVQGLDDGINAGFRAFTYDDSSGRFIAFGDGGILVSSEDGQAWERGEGADFTEDNPMALAAGGGVVVAVTPGQVSRSTDGGLTWEPAQMMRGSTKDVAYARDGFVALGVGRASLSPDGVEWTSVSVDGLDGSLACHDETCVAVTNNRAFRSVDGGQSWELAQEFSSNTQYIEAVAWGPVE